MVIAPPPVTTEATDTQTVAKASRRRKTAHWLMVLVFILMLMSAGAISIAGILAVPVETSAMAPVYRAGSLLIERPLQVGDLRPGDIVSFRMVDDPAHIHTGRVQAISVAGNQAAVVISPVSGGTGQRWQAPPTERVGIVLFSIPLAGYPFHVLSQWWTLSVIIGSGVLILWRLSSLVANNERRPGG